MARRNADTRTREEKLYDLSDDRLDERLRIAHRRGYSTEHVAVLEAELRRRGYEPSAWYREASR